MLALDNSVEEDGVPLSKFVKEQSQKESYQNLDGEHPNKRRSVYNLSEGDLPILQGSFIETVTRKNRN